MVQLLEPLPLLHRLRADSYSRPPNWRWAKARYLLEAGRTPSRSKDDAWTRLAWRFQQTQRDAVDDMARMELFDDHPAVFDARELKELENIDLKSSIEARILARQPRAEIAAKTATPESVLEAYEALFFHVADRLEAIDWVCTYVMGPAMTSGISARDKDLIWKIVGFGFGPCHLEWYMDRQPARDSEPGRERARNDGSQRDELSRQGWIATKTMVPNSHTQIMIAGLLHEVQKSEREAGGADPHGEAVAGLHKALLALKFQVAPSRSSAPALPAAEPRAAEMVRRALPAPSFREVTVDAPRTAHG